LSRFECYVSMAARSTGDVERAVHLATSAIERGRTYEDPVAVTPTRTYSVAASAFIDRFESAGVPSPRTRTRGFCASFWRILRFVGSF